MLTDTSPLGRVRQQIVGMAHAPFLKTFDHWLAIKSQHALPNYEDFDPVAVGPALPSIYVVELTGDNLVYRLAGELVEQRYGISLRGKQPHEFLHPEDADRMVQRRKKILGQRQVAISETAYRRADSASTLYGHRLLLPFNRYGKPTVVLSVVRYLDSEQLPFESAQTQKGDAIWELFASAV